MLIKLANAEAERENIEELNEILKKCGGSCKLLGEDYLDITAPPKNVHRAGRPRVYGIDTVENVRKMISEQGATATAKQLKIGRTTLYKRLKECEEKGETTF